MATDENCIFCKIIAGKIPSRKFIETDKAYAFLDIGPTAPGHSLIIPKYHAAKFHELPDETLSDILPVAKKIALATGATDYNLLQNNGRIAHQVVGHVHFHVIPKPNEEQGLVVGWPSTSPSKEELDEL
ncbi:bis(5'-nucleosyl)-tetraphosphatase (asymmetrical) [Malassezia brasiliensis]|uniref:Bis(5'-nucleosyl)-tetraphosphatase (Asymmetrical) n=1 Tax=Malassezia brasiliensis TaxID=1821822 RepID=A0AAF0DXA7_9BASI|nr:bis(5'-nucleosyl)-tetraphosphatase (asymmetrical) [Malassezia brasiliensis]